MPIEFKSIPIEVKDIDEGQRMAVIAHATYDSIDRTGDIVRKGAFTKSWNENKDDINLYVNHDDTQAPGKVIDLFEDDAHAYTRAQFGTHTLGVDTLKMLSEGIIRKSSFGYNTVKSFPLNVKEQKVREIKELRHWETSVLTKHPAHPGSGIVSVFKSMHRDDVIDLKQHLKNLESFCRNTTASDDCIKSMLSEIENIKSILSFDTASTHDDEPNVSNSESESTSPEDSGQKALVNEAVLKLKLLTLKM